MRTIEIGLEVHKAIEAGRQSLNEPENEILIRMLRLQKVTLEAPSKPILGKAAWKSGRVELPHGTELRVAYSGQSVDGIIDDGRWLVKGNFYTSPSMALIHSVTTKKGKQTNLNGWNHWTAKRPLDRGYMKLSEIRARS